MPGLVDVWITTERGVPESRLHELGAMLSKQEIQRAERHKYADDRNLFIVAHSFVRRVLSQYAAVGPEAWVFRIADLGRPELATEPQGASLFFSLSHTRGLVAVAVSAIQEIGIDIENEGVQADLREVAKYILSRAERDALADASEDEFGWRFLELWTLKEAYLKALGLGFSTAPDSFSFSVQKERIELTFHGPDDVQLSGTPWTFRSHRPTLNHQLAVAVHTADAEIAFHWLSTASPDVRMRRMSFGEGGRLP